MLKLMRGHKERPSKAWETLDQVVSFVVLAIAQAIAELATLNKFEFHPKQVVEVMLGFADEFYKLKVKNDNNFERWNGWNTAKDDMPKYYNTCTYTST